MLLLDFLRADGNLTTNKKLARAIGLHEAILYQELISRYIYFSDRKRLTDDGYFFNCIEDLEFATTLSDKQQRKCINKLKDLKLIFYRVKGIPAKRYFKINLDARHIENVIETHCNSQLSQKGKTWIAEKEKVELSKGQCNNTNINNTKEIILKNINVISSKDDDGNLSFFSSLFSYYIDKYNIEIGDNHPIIHIDTVKAIIKVIGNFANNYEVRTLAKWRKIIDRYFDSDMSCDYNMVHFANESIIYNKAHNLKLVD